MKRNIVPNSIFKVEMLGTPNPHIHFVQTTCPKEALVQYLKTKIHQIKSFSFADIINSDPDTVIITAVIINKRRWVRKFKITLIS